MIEEPIRGILTTTTPDGVRVIRVHYTADPDKDPERNGAEWFKRELMGYKMGVDDPRWLKEMEIDFDATGGQLLFPYLAQYQEHILIEPFVVRDMELRAGLDYGTRNPSAFEVLAIDGQDIYVVYEYYEPPKGKSEDEMAFKERKGYKVLCENIMKCPFFGYIPIYADPSLWNKTQEGRDERKSMADLFAEEGVRLIPATRGGDFACWEKMDKDLWATPDMPRLKIFKTCEWLWWELRRLRFADYSGAVQVSHNLQEKIVDKDNHCYCYDTDILTKKGWKNFPDLKDDDSVAVWNNGKIDYEIPSEVQRIDYVGQMCLYEQGNLNFCVTPNHKMWVANQYSVKIKKKPEFKRVAVNDLPQVSWVMKKAEGVVNASALAQIEKDKIQKIKYSGKVYCVTTNSGVVMVRRKGKPMWCGQSWDAVKYAITSDYQTATQKINWQRCSYRVAA